VLVLSADQPCEIPDLVLMTPAAAGKPGRELVRLPARRVSDGQPRVVDVSAEVPAALIASLRCELAEPQHGSISLVRRRD
jgi:hypothetical protein